MKMFLFLVLCWSGCHQVTTHALVATFCNLTVLNADQSVTFSVGSYLTNLILSFHFVEVRATGSCSSSSSSSHELFKFLKKVIYNFYFMTLLRSIIVVLSVGWYP